MGGVGDGRVGEDGVGLEEGGFERSLPEGGRKASRHELRFEGREGLNQEEMNSQEQEKVEQREEASGDRRELQRTVQRCLSATRLLRTSECYLEPTEINPTESEGVSKSELWGCSK